MKQKILSIVVFLLVITPVQGNDKLKHLDMDRFFDCLWNKESGYQTSPKDGDNGQSIGPYQIKRSYWQDALEFDQSIGGRYEDCRSRIYSQKIILAYMKRYAPENATYEDLCRTHNGGPKGRFKNSTIKYWQDKKFDPLRVR